MRKSLWLALAALSLAVFSPAAHADLITDGTLTFTPTFGSPTPTGSFVYGDTTNTWTSFTVDWDGVVFDFGAALNGSKTTLAAFNAISPSWCGEAPEEPDGTVCTEAGSFNLGSQVEIGPETPANFTDETAVAFGSYTVTETAVTVPAPPIGRGLLVLLAVLFAAKLLARNRKQHSITA
jgi:hypothetical protein